MREEQGADLGWEKRQEALAGKISLCETPEHLCMSAQDLSLLAVYEIGIIDRSTRGYASSYGNTYFKKQQQKMSFPNEQITED